MLYSKLWLISTVSHIILTNPLWMPAQNALRIWASVLIRCLTMTKILTSDRIWPPRTCLEMGSVSIKREPAAIPWEVETHKVSRIYAAGTKKPVYLEHLSPAVVPPSSIKVPSRACGTTTVVSSTTQPTTSVGSILKRNRTSLCDDPCNEMRIVLSLQYSYMLLYSRN